MPSYTVNRRLVAGEQAIVLDLEGSAFVEVVPQPQRRSFPPCYVQGCGAAEASSNARYSDNFQYGTIGYLNIGKVLRIVKPRPQDAFCDIGCGMGRILCVAARKPMRKCIGVELLEPLCEIARRNVASLRGRKAPIEIVCGDATTVDLSEGTIYFMFNPFGAETLRDTLENIRGSLSQKPRAIKTAYYNSQYVSVFETLRWLEKVHEFNTFGRTTRRDCPLRSQPGFANCRV